MGYVIEADRSQVLLLPQSIEDWIPADDPARFIYEFVYAIEPEDIEIVQRRGEDGRPPYGWRLLLCIWLYGWFYGVRSTRGLERACRRDIGLIWLTGQNYPDHNSIWRFYRDNKKSIRQLFRRSVQVAMRNELVGLVLQAVDGTKLGANASRYKDKSQKRLKKALEQLDAIIDAAMAEIESRQAKDDRPSERLPPHLEEKMQLRDKIAKDLQLLRAEDVANRSDTDPEARLMHGRHGDIAYRYNAQAVVDADNGIITAADVVQDEADNHLLDTQMAEAESNTGAPTAMTVADAGYFSSEQVAKAEASAQEVLIAIPANHNKTKQHTQDSPFHVDNLSYDKEHDCFRCPRGATLHCTGVSHKRGKIAILQYRCDGYQDCPYHAECTKGDGPRRLNLSRDHAAVRQHLRRQREGTARMQLRLRRQLIEPRFGFIKSVLGVIRLLTRGLTNAKARWHLACTVANLHRMYRLRGMNLRFA